MTGLVEVSLVRQHLQNEMGRQEEAWTQEHAAHRLQTIWVTGDTRMTEPWVTGDPKKDGEEIPGGGRHPTTPQAQGDVGQHRR